MIGLKDLLGWIIVWFTVFLLTKFIVKRIAMSKSSMSGRFIKINKAIQKWHMGIGICLIFVAFVHGIVLSSEVFTLNMGMTAFIVSILILLTYLLRNAFKNKRTWIIFHRVFAVLFVGFILMHVLDKTNFSLTAGPSGNSGNNVVQQNIQGNSATPAAGNDKNAQTGDKVFSLSELAKYDGKNGMPSYVAVDGVVYDVSRQFRGGNHNGVTAGKDLSAEFRGQHNDNRINLFPKVGVLQK